MATQEKTWNVANRLHSQKDSDNPEVNHIIAGADEIYDDAKGAKQSDINAQADAALADRYTKNETYSKEQLDSLITTPDVNYVTVATFADLPQTGEADTIYRVSSYDGTQVDASKYALYAWNGATYQLLAVRSAVGEVFDVSEYNTGATYETLTAALAAVPASVQRGGMSIKFILRTNTGTEGEPVYKDEFVQYRLMNTAWSSVVSDWQGVDNELTAGSRNLVESGVVQNELALGAVYDVSAKNPTAGPNNDGKFESLSALLSDANLNTLIPTAVRKGGMSIKFIQSSDNKYVQYRLMADEWSTTVANWQGVDETPTPNSQNLVESKGVSKTNSYFLKKSQLGNHFNPIKNLINISDLLYGKSVSSGQWVDSPNGICTNKMVFQDGVTYAMQGIGCYSATPSIFIGYFDISDNFLGRTSITATLDDPDVNRGKALFTYSSQSFANTAYCRIVLQNGNTAPLDTSLCQVEVNNQYTEVVGFEEVADIDYISNQQADNKVNTEMERALVSEKMAARGLFINYNHIMDVISTTEGLIKYKESLNWDCIIIVLSGQEKIELQGVTHRDFRFFDSLDIFTGENVLEHFINSDGSTGVVPSNAKICICNAEKAENPDGYDNIRLVCEYNNSRYEEVEAEIKEINDDLSVKNYSYITPNDINQNHRIKSDYSIAESSVSDIYKYTGIVAGNTYAFSNRQTEGYNIYMCFWVDSNDNIIGLEPYKGVPGQIDIWTNVEIVAPENATQMWMNVNHNSASYANFSSVTKEIVSVQQLVDKDNELEESKAKKKKIRFLSIGNSYSGDALAYVPFILQNMGIDADIQIGILSMSSSTLANHVDNFNNETTAYTFHFYNGGTSWEHISEKTIQWALDTYTWDCISLQQSSGSVFTWSTYQPYLNQLVTMIGGYVDYNIKFGWYAAQARPGKTNGGVNWDDATITSHYESIVANSQKVMNETACEFLMPVGTAVQNARTIASIKALGDYANDSDNTSGLGYLTSDGVHLQEGLPSQIAAYTFVLSILRLYDFNEYSIIGETTRVTSEWAADKSIPGPHGDYIGSTDANCLIAQLSAIMAIKKPYEVTDMNYIVNPN